MLNYNEFSEPPPIEKTYVPQKKVVAQKPKIEKYVASEVVKEEIEESEEIITVEEVKEVITPVEIVEESDDIESVEGIETDAPLNLSLMSIQNFQAEGRPLRTGWRKI